MIIELGITEFAALLVLGIAIVGSIFYIAFNVRGLMSSIYKLAQIMYGNHIELREHEIEILTAVKRKILETERI